MLDPADTWFSLVKEPRGEEGLWGVRTSFEEAVGLDQPEAGSTGWERKLSSV